MKKDIVSILKKVGAIITDSHSEQIFRRGYDKFVKGKKRLATEKNILKKINNFFSY